MLYLNADSLEITEITEHNLTLTSVVFEFFSSMIFKTLSSAYLTLTSVVFESSIDGALAIYTRIFNFNKCCI